MMASTGTAVDGARDGARDGGASGADDPAEAS